VSCTDGTINVSQSGGVGPFTYSLNGGTPQTQPVFSALGTGTYTITIYDTGTGCEASIETTLGVCGKVTLYAITNISGVSGRPVWSKVNPHFPYGNFTLEYRRLTAPIGSWISITGIQDTTYNITGLQSGITYQVRVRYVCGEGFSNWSDSTALSVFTTLQSVCETPFNVTTSATGTAGQRWISWTGSGSANYYVVGVGPITQTPSAWPVQVVIAPSTTHLRTGLNPALNYRARVLANCTNDPDITVQGPGTSSWSTTSASFKPTATRLMAYTTTTETTFSIYPNPNKGCFTLRVESADIASIDIRMTDALGRVVFTTRHDVVVGFNDIDLNLIGKAASGIYALSFIQNGTVHTVKVVIE
jgi:hypothetical protein